MTEIATQDAQYALNLVAAICTQVGPGMPGTPQERQRAVIVQKELEAHLGPEHVAVEEFPVAPWAMLSSLPLSAVFMLLSALLNLSLGRIPGVAPWLTAVASLVFSLFSLLVILVVFVYNVELLDPFFKKKTSVNVIGSLRSPGSAPITRLLLFGGHHDSAPENTWLGLLRSGFFFAAIIWGLGFAVMLAMGLIQLAGVLIGRVDLARFGTLGWVLLVFPILPSILYGLFFNRGRQGGGTVPGAADNLSASAVVVALSRFLARHPETIPPATEIRFVSFGSEEAGLRGSRPYVARHLDELQRLDARLLNFEVLTHPLINILSSDINGTVKNSPDMVASLVAAAQCAGLPYRVRPASLGNGSDAGPFSEAGLKAATLLDMQMPQQMVAFYHQKSDRPDVLTIEPLLNVLKLSIEWVRCRGE